MPTPLQINFVPARHFRAVSGDRGIWWIVLHTAESQELPNTAEGVANYFRTLDRAASAHYTCDSNSIVQSVLDVDVAYGAPGANRHGLHIEHAGYARQTVAEWHDAYSHRMLAISAGLAAEKCRRYAIPAVWLSPADLKAGKRGITSHANCTKAFGGSHTDPGPDFPVAEYIEAVQALLLPAPTEQQRTAFKALVQLIDLFEAAQLPEATQRLIKEARNHPPFATMQRGDIN